MRGAERPRKKTFTKDKAAPDAEWRCLFFAGVEPPDALTDSGDAVMDPVKPAVRIDAANPRHHLWNNHGTWWCHLTVHLPDHTKYRFRTSLETRSLEEACRVRDSLLALLGVRPQER
jgi:hypothetical protein